MKVNVQAVNFDIQEKLKAHIEKKTKKYEKKLGQNVELDIHLSVVKPETNNNKEVRIKVLGISGIEPFAQKVSDTFEQSFDDALEAIERQLEKHKER